MNLEDYSMGLVIITGCTLLNVGMIFRMMRRVEQDVAAIKEKLGIDNNEE